MESIEDRAPSCRDAGPVLVFGSGEIAPGAQHAYRTLFSALQRPIRMAILETPAGFELNSHWVACRVANYVEEHLQNFVPEVTVVPARKRGTHRSPDDPSVVAPLRRARVVYMGAGSPTYAARQLRASHAWHLLVARQRSGAGIIFASASVLAAGAYTIPVYEIYKVGEDVHWTRGLDFFGQYGLSLAFVPHWNNTDGGANLDTSRCFMGRPRFGQLMEMLPDGVAVVGIDERSHLHFDLRQRECAVSGPGGVTVIREGFEEFFGSETKFPISVLGAFQMPCDAADGIPPDVWAIIEATAAEEGRERSSASPVPPGRVLELVEQRATARARRDWSAADAIRDEIATLGWQVRDTPDGPQITAGGG
jgi:hypothetical protein